MIKTKIVIKKKKKLDDSEEKEKKNPFQKKGDVKDKSSEEDDEKDSKEKSSKEKDKKDTDKDSSKKKVPPFFKKKSDSKKDDEDQPDDSDKSGKESKSLEKKPPFGKKDDKDKSSEKKKGPSNRGKGPEITEPVKIDFEPALDEQLVLYLLDNDITDINEHREIINECVREVSLIEALSIAGRIKRRAAIRRNRSRIRMGRQRAMRRRATQSQIKSRARKTAISNMKLRYAGGRPTERLSYTERARIEKLVSKRRGAIRRATLKLIRKKRNLDSQRFNNRNRRR